MNIRQILRFITIAIALLIGIFFRKYLESLGVDITVPCCSYLFIEALLTNVVFCVILYFLFTLKETANYLDWVIVCILTIFSVPAESLLAYSNQSISYITTIILLIIYGYYVYYKDRKAYIGNNFYETYNYYRGPIDIIATPIVLIVISAILIITKITSKLYFYLIFSFIVVVTIILVTYLVIRFRRKFKYSGYSFNVKKGKTLSNKKIGNKNRNSD